MIRSGQAVGATLATLSALSAADGLATSGGAEALGDGIEVELGDVGRLASGPGSTALRYWLPVSRRAVFRVADGPCTVEALGKARPGLCVAGMGLPPTTGAAFAMRGAGPCEGNGATAKDTGAAGLPFTRDSLLCRIGKEPAVS